MNDCISKAIICMFYWIHACHPALSTCVFTTRPTIGKAKGHLLPCASGSCTTACYPIDGRISIVSGLRPNLPLHFFPDYSWTLRKNFGPYGPLRNSYSQKPSFGPFIVFFQLHPIYSLYTPCSILNLVNYLSSMFFLGKLK